MHLNLRVTSDCMGIELLAQPEGDIIEEMPSYLRDPLVGYTMTALEYLVRKQGLVEFLMFKCFTRSLPKHMTLKGYECRMSEYEIEIASAGKMFLASDAPPEFKALYEKAAQCIPPKVREVLAACADPAYASRMDDG